MMLSKDAFILLFVIALLGLVSSGGCAFLQDGNMTRSPVATGDQTSGVIDAGSSEEVSVTDNMFVEVLSNGATSQLSFPGEYSTLGNVLSKLDAVPTQPVTAIIRANNAIYIPTYFATNTDASKIAIEDGDSVRFLNWEDSPIAIYEPNGVKPIRQRLISEFDFYENGEINQARFEQGELQKKLKVKRAQARLKSAMTNEDGSPEEIEQAQQLLNAAKKELEAMRNIKSQYENALKNLSGFIGSYRIEGLVQNGGRKELKDLTTMDDVFGNNKIAAILNGVPANIIVLERGSTVTVLPVRRELQTVVIPQSVKKQATDAYLSSYVKDGDVFQYTRLSLFAPVRDGIKKDLAAKLSAKVNRKIAGVAREAMQNSKSYYGKLEQQHRNKEPGPLMKALRSLPNQLPDLKIPGFRLPGF